MSIIKLGPENFQTYRLVANPKKVFTSSSVGGVTGSVALFADASPRLKEVHQTFGEAEVGFTDDYFEGHREGLFTYGESAESERYAHRYFQSEKYLRMVNEKPQGAAHQKRQEVLRFIPGAKLNKNHGSKATIQKVLFPYYRNKYQNLEWGYTNYNSLNFFYDDTLPGDSALIYPITGSPDETGQSLNFYAPSGSFTFDFYIKPKVNLNDSPGSEYNPGTILHMSSCYAISVVSGTSRGLTGTADKFRVLLQLSQSADISPSSCILSRKSVSSAYGDPGFLFASSDNSLEKDKWHHVSIRWPGGSVNGGSGSISIDGVHDTSFVMKSGSVMQITQSNSSKENPNALFVGKYYEGTNEGSQAISKFFNIGVSSRQGLTPYLGVETEPTGFNLKHSLFGEVHDIKIFNQEKSDEDVAGFKKRGIREITSDLLFFVPPFFTHDTRKRDILQTPFFDTTGSSNDPFNAALSFGVGGLEINLENFTREFVKGEFPRLHNLTASRIDTSVYREGRTSNDIMYSSGSAIKRLYTILPCDNGKFEPNFSLLSTGSSTPKFVDDFGMTRYDLVHLENMVSTASLPEGLRSLASVPPRTMSGDNVLSIPEGLLGSEDAAQFTTGSFLFELQGSSPEDPSVSPGNILTILQRTGDPSSNEVVFFDASNMFYGDAIKPGTVLIEDLNPTGSNKSFNFKVRDNGFGNLYRADTPISGSAKWASVGNVLYEEGLMVIKTPHMGFFGKDDFRITFEGTRTVHVFEVSIPLVENLHNSSSNPQYKFLRPTGNANESAEDFVYVTGVNLHDDNLNVIGRANLAQPFIKREEDRVVIKLRMDY